MVCKKCAGISSEGSSFCAYCGEVFDESVKNKVSDISTEQSEPVAKSFVSGNKIVIDNVAEKKPREEASDSFKGFIPSRRRLRKIICILLVSALIGCAVFFAVSYESSDKALENIIEYSLDADADKLERYNIRNLAYSVFGFSKEAEKELTKDLEGYADLEKMIYNRFIYELYCDDFDVDWSISSEKSIRDEYAAELQKGFDSLIENGFVSTFFNRPAVIDCVEYEIDFEAQELQLTARGKMKVVMANINLRWYLVSAQWIE